MGTLFSGSARKTYELFQKAGLTHQYNEGELQPGDVIFWPLPTDYWHVAVYVGDGKVAGNHYVAYRRRLKALKSAGKPLGEIVLVGNMPVYKGVDARDILSIEGAAGTPIAYARLTEIWRRK